MAPEDESQGLFSYECGDKDAPISSGDGPIFSEVLHRETKHSEDHVKHLKLWAQKVATEFRLKASQFSELSMFIHLRKNLDTGNLCMHIWQLAIGYRLLNGQDKIMAHSVNMQNAVETASAGIKGRFQLSVDQAMQVLIIAKDLVMQVGQTNYKGLHYDVEEWLKLHADVLGFQNVFGNPANEHVLCTCNYGKVHQYIAGTAVDDKSGNKSSKEGASGEDVSTSELPVKCAKSGSSKAPPSRVKGGCDFWSAIDWMFTKDFEWYGKDMKNDKWCGLFNKIILLDQACYGKNSGSILQALPSMYTEPATLATTFNPHVLPGTTIHHGTSCMGQPIGPAHSNSSNQLLTSNNAEALLGDDF
ncbi:hypothetical protein EDC04DRAFT_2896824 [Pisolithus marmoratus]|nr:hypothetical protein EDC04DRAFT_2896824 [Pisolithus marmoratus]